MGKNVSLDQSLPITRNVRIISNVWISNIIITKKNEIQADGVCLSCVGISLSPNNKTGAAKNIIHLNEGIIK